MKNKPGFHATLIIIIVLAIGLAGAVGYIFWNNMNGSSKSDTSKTPENKVTLKKYVANSSKIGFNFGFDYPADWTVAETTDPQYSNRFAITVKDPNNKISLIYNLFYNNGIGGGCSPTDNEVLSKGTVQSFNKKGDVLSLGDTKATAHETIYTKNDIVTYESTYMRIPRSETPEIKVGDDYCQMSFDGLISLTPESYRPMYPDSKDPNDKQYTINAKMVASIKINELYPNDKIKANLKVADVENAKKTNEYKQAVDILLSTSYSKI